MYNEERKQQFLREKSENSILSNNIYAVFDIIEEREKQYGRDICEWTSEEILSFFKWYSSRSIQTLVQLQNALKIYTDWCLLNGLVKDNQNHFTEIKSSALCECVDINTMDEFVMSRQDFLSMINELPNLTDQFIMLALYEGIPTLQIQYVKLEDLNDGVVTLHNGETRNVSHRLSNIMHLADEEKEYVSMGKKQHIYPYVEGRELARPFISYKGVQNDFVVSIGGRIRTCSKYVGMPVGITIKSIIESGRIDFIKTYSEEHNIDPIQMIEDKNYRIYHEKIFGKIQNIKVYKKIYSKYFT